MKKLSLLLLLTLFFGAAMAQAPKSTVYLSQDFSGSFQTDGWTIENYTTKWTKVNTSNAGGVAPELRFEYTSGTSTTRFISPSVDLSGVNDLFLSFKQLVDHYGSGYSIGVATRSNQGAWNTVWTTPPASDIGPETRDIIIANGDVGSSDFQFCFFLTGDAYQIDYWYIDDVLLYTPYDLDLQVSKINLDKYITSGTISPIATVKNAGINNITSFDIKYQVDNGEMVSENVSGIDLSSGQYFVHTFSETWNATPGNYDLKVMISNVNGVNDDDNTSNNELVETISIASNSVENIPLFESFTSSTCPPCFTFNTNTFTPFLNSHQGEYSIIKYQMNWPGNGDIYYNDEGGVRRTYYGVSAVPTLITGGIVTGTNSTELNNNFNSEASKSAFFTIDAVATYEGTTVTADINIIPYINVTGFVFHAAIVEKETTGNVGTNGETSFKYVMMKMLPNANGTNISLTDNETYSLALSHNISSTNVEEMSDLMLVSFIQNPTTKQIFQSSMVDITTNTSINSDKNTALKLYPNPSNGNFTIEIPGAQDNVIVDVYTVTGSLIYSQQFNNHSNSINLNINQQKGVYMVKVSLPNGDTSINKLIIR